MPSRRTISAAALSFVAVAISWLSSAMAAVAEPPNDDHAPAPLPTTVPAVRTVVHSGTPIWIFVLAAVLAAACTLTLTLIVGRLRHPHQRGARPGLIASA
jgi:hypothetical protein